MKKGSFGYLQKKRIYSLLKSLLLLLAVLVIYFGALHHFKTNKNIFTLLAAAGALPTGRSIVVTIMCLRAKGASAKVRDAVEAVPGLPRQSSGYDICLTTYDDQFSLGHVTVCNKKVLGLAENDAAQSALCGQHIRQMLDRDGYTEYEVKILPDPDSYVRALTQLCAEQPDVSGAVRTAEETVGAGRAEEEAAGAGQMAEETAVAGRAEEEAAGAGQMTEETAGAGRTAEEMPPEEAAGRDAVSVKEQKREDDRRVMELLYSISL